VNTILAGLGVEAERPLIEVWNKLDRLETDDKDTALSRAAREDQVYPVSALTGEGMSDLLDAVKTALNAETFQTTLALGFDEGRKRAWLFEHGLVEEEQQTDEGFTLNIRWTQKQAAQFQDT